MRNHEVFFQYIILFALVAVLVMLWLGDVPAGSDKYFSQVLAALLVLVNLKSGSGTPQPPSNTNSSS